MTTARYAIAILLAAAVTVVLFFEMQVLISADRPVHVRRPAAPAVEFVRLRKPPAPRAVKPAPASREPLEKPPPIPGPAFGPPHAPAPALGPAPEAAPAWGPPQLRLRGVSAFGGTGAETDALPLVRISPRYPESARRRGIEGHVDVEFTIGTEGEVKNPRVVDSSPHGVFERAALEAVRRWRYRPRIEAGRAVERPGVRVRLKFELED